MNATNVCSSGSLVEANLHNGFAIVAGPGIAPGEGRRAEVTIVNVGPLATTLCLCETLTSTEFTPKLLFLEIKELRQGAGRRLFLGEIGAVAAGGIDLGHFKAGESRIYCFTLLLRKGAPDGERQHSAGATYEWRQPRQAPSPSSSGAPTSPLASEGSRA